MIKPLIEFDLLVNQMAVPLIAAPMFIVSNPDLVVAQCTSGIIGSFPALNARPQELLDDLKWDFNVTYDEKDAVGRRYRRQDAAGTPFCITIDHDTKEDKQVTVRNRDTMEQKRIPMAEVKAMLAKEVDFRTWMDK